MKPHDELQCSGINYPPDLNAIGLLLELRTAQEDHPHRRGARGGGRPPRGLGVPPAEGPPPPPPGPGVRGGKLQKTLQSPDRLYKAPKRLYKAPTDYTKPRKDTKPRNIRQNPKVLDKDLTYLTRVATNINSTNTIKYLI